MMIKRIVALTLSLLVVALLLSCAVNPVTGKREFMLLTEADEQALGADTDRQIAQMYGLYEDADLNAYIVRVGQDIGIHTHRKGLAYKYKVLDSPVVNAFAVPGGYIYVTRGILSYFNNEAELAGVLGHELGHVNARHTARNYSRAVLAQAGLGLGSALSEGFAKYSGYVQFGVQMLFLSFSRSDERQADDLGVEYSSKAGYDSNHMAVFFETLERMNPRSGSWLPAWFSTHPNPADRVQAVHAKTVEWQNSLALNAYKENREDFLEQIDGLVFGNDPRQGYVEGNAFYHPTMRFSFPLPAGWAMDNLPSQVQIVTPNQDAVILLTLAEGATPLEAAEKFYADLGASVHESRSLNIHGHPAYRKIADIVEKTEGEDAEKEGIRVISTFIRKDNRIFAFHGFSSLERFSAYSGIFTQTMDNFRNLTDPSKINVMPSRIQVRTVTRSTNLKAALQGFGVNPDRLEETALLNGMFLNDTVPAGTMLKIVR